MGSEAILVVDDDAEALAFCCSVLADSGYRVLPAASGEEALTISNNENGRIDLALVDVVMPEMTGIDLAKRLEAIERCPKVALISGHTPEEMDRLIGEEGSSYRIIWKPFDIQIFLQMVRNVLDTPQRVAVQTARS